MKLTKPLLMLSTLALTTASTTALADQSTEQVMGGNHQLPARYYNYGSQWAEDNQVMTAKPSYLSYKWQYPQNSYSPIYYGYHDSYGHWHDYTDSYGYPMYYTNGYWYYR